MSALIKGTLILTLATIISKVLGFIYVVPFTAMVGTQGYILFEYAYKPYVIILSFATLGIPLAVSKFVSKHNELGDYRAGQRLFKSGLLFLTATGSICFLMLFSFAPSIASMLVNENDKTGNSLEDVTFVIRMVSFALIIVPPMAIARGFFQGHQQMTPTAISQVVEQIVRIVFILVAAFLVINVLDGTITVAVGLATFAACLGAVAGSFVLYHYWKKMKPDLKKHAELSTKTSDAPISDMYKELISYAIPFVIVGLAIPLYQTIDTFTINQAMMSTGVNQLAAETVNSVVALVQKIIMIPVSLATALSLTLVPTITKSFVARDYTLLKSQTSKTFMIVLFLTLPCVVLLMALSEPAFSFLFGAEHAVLGGELMMWYAPTAILLSLFSVTAAILQGMDRHKFVILSLAIGFGFKVSTNYFFVTQFEGIGSVISTDIGFILSIAMNVWALKYYGGFSIPSVLKPTTAILILTGTTGIIVGILDILIQGIIGTTITNVFLNTGIRLTIGGIIGMIFYCVIAHKTKLMQLAMGEEMVNKLLNKVLSPLKRFKK